MEHDIFWQPVSLPSGTSLENWNGVLRGFLSHAAATPAYLAAVLDAEPDFAKAHAIKGLFLLLLGRRELIADAGDALRNARAAAARTAPLPNEAPYIEALADWMADRPEKAVERFEGVLTLQPDDTLAMKLGHAIRFVLGDGPGMRASIERVLPAYAPDHPGRGYLLGCQAFALEETGAYLQAEIAGRQALWMASDDAWGLHAVAHVHDMTGNASRGLDWLSGREAAWAHCNNFRYHVSWHKALMLLDLGRTETVLELYDREIRKDRTDDHRDISNATSLLMRLELNGVDVGARWDELADLSAERTEDGCLIFADLHYLMALTRGGRDGAVADLLGRLHSDANRADCVMSRRMAQPGVPAALGLEAFGDGNYADAFGHLVRARETMQLAGGSHAQRDVFERITIDAGLRAGLLDATETLLDDRRRNRGGHEDGYSAARRALIASGRDAATRQRVPAE
ncbi:tetratricopeptide repeat protein [Chachezhania antarctica]|uniref:tetratricopeptide repeat protein n=1 Tax=Chachezhania antarctica TaxID=2340860 RepID=UPI000EAD4973|nr:tetratricopeptide repeat protein [Chachezhania antarctica]